MKITITGANCFLGMRLTAKLMEKGHEVTLVMRSHHKKYEDLPQAKVIWLDFQDYGQLGAYAGSCDCFVHLAWAGTRGLSRMDAALQRRNLEYSVAAVKSMLEAGCRRIITAGSQAEYGPYAGMITEENECHPNTEYGKAKLSFYGEVERLCTAWGAEFREPRFFSLYGPGDYDGTMITNVLKNMMENLPCPLTRCVQNWDYLYVDDAAEAFCLLCTADCPDGVYNFGSGDTRKLKDYILEMANLTSTRSELQFGAVAYPPTGIVSLWPDVSKLKTTLRWEPRTSFADGIKTMMNKISCASTERNR